MSGFEAHLRLHNQRVTGSSPVHPAKLKYLKEMQLCSREVVKMLTLGIYVFLVNVLSSVMEHIAVGISPKNRLVNL